MQYDIQNLSIESVAAQWEKVKDFSEGATNPESNQEMMATVMNNLEKVAKEPKKAPAAPVAAAPAKPAAPKQAEAPAATGLKSENIFGMMATYLDQGHGKELIPKVAAVFGFEILAKKGAKPSLIYAIDLKNG